MTFVTIKMATLPREILRWIQSLDLAYSVKNVRRDFANGFLVAEIISRYKPELIQMSSYDTAARTDAKFDNWQQLDRVFLTLGFGINRQDWEPVIYAAPDAAVKIIKKLYEKLLDKTVKDPPVIASPQRQKQTTSLLLRDSETLVKPESMLVDPTEAESVDEVVSPLKVIPRGQTRTLTKNVGSEGQHAIEIKEVSVKPVEKNVANMRAAKSLTIQRTQESSASIKTTESPIRMPAADQASVATKAITDVLTELLVEACQRYENASFNDIEPENMMKVFVDQVDQMSDEVVSAFFEGLVHRGSIILDILFKSQHEFWRFISICMPCMQKLHLASQGFAMLMESFTSIIEKMVNTDPELMEGYFGTFVLGKLVSIVTQYPNKMEVMCHLLYAFTTTEPDARMKHIQKFAMKLDNHIELIKCLSFLIKFDKDYNDELHDIFIYYALVGLDNSSPIVRTCSLSIFSSIAALNPLPILHIVGNLKLLSEDPWWECRAQVLQCAGTLLSTVEQNEELNASIEVLIELVHTAFHVNASKNVLRVALIYLAPALQRFPNLARRYVECLLTLTAEVRGSLLDISESESMALTEEGTLVAGTNTQRYRLSGAPFLWNQDIVVEKLVEIIQEEQLGNLDETHFEVLRACMMQPIDESNWKEYFNTLKDYLYVALCDPENYSIAGELILKLFSYKSMVKHIVETSEETLSKAVKLLSNDECIENVKELFSQLMQYEDERVKIFVKNFLHQFKDQHSEEFTKFGFEIPN